jgi:spore maturation protein B
VPAEILPLLFTRPFSGSASNKLFLDLVNTHGVDSLSSKMAAYVLGSTETMLYIIMLYFGAVGVKKMRYAVLSCLMVYVVAVIGALVGALWSV